MEDNSVIRISFNIAIIDNVDIDISILFSWLMTQASIIDYQYRFSEFMLVYM